MQSDISSDCTDQAATAVKKLEPNRCFNIALGNRIEAGKVIDHNVVIAVFSADDG